MKSILIVGDKSAELVNVGILWEFHRQENFRLCKRKIVGTEDSGGCPSLPIAVGENQCGGTVGELGDALHMWSVDLIFVVIADGEGALFFVEHVYRVPSGNPEFVIVPCVGLEVVESTPFWSIDLAGNFRHSDGSVFGDLRCIRYEGTSADHPEPFIFRIVQYAVGISQGDGGVLSGFAICVVEPDFSACGLNL